MNFPGLDTPENKANQHALEQPLLSSSGLGQQCVQVAEADVNDGWFAFPSYFIVFSYISPTSYSF